MQGRHGEHRLQRQLIGVGIAVAAALLLVAGVAVAHRLRASRPSYSFATSHTPLRMVRGETAVLRLRFTRRNGFRGPLTLGIRHLPAHSKPRWVLPNGRALKRKLRTRRSVLLPARARAAVLLVRTTARTRLGRFRPRLTVTAHHQRRFTFLRVRVVPRFVRSTPMATTSGLRLSAAVGAPLYPGASAPLRVRIRNPYDVPVTVTALRADVDDATSKRACNGRANYEVRQYAGPYPLLIPPGTTSLNAVVADADALPRVAMRDLPVNQDACRGAIFTLSLSAEGTR